LEKGNPESQKIIETRFLVRHTNREKWDGFSYLWNDEATDAVLLGNSYTKTFNIQDGDETITQDYYYPSREDCITCHTDAAGFVLGLKTSQINKQHLYINESDSVWDNQLRSYNNIGLFTTDIGDDYGEFPKLTNPFDENESLENRARAYLDANCANCHRPGSSGRTNMDLRFDIPLEAMHVIGIPPELNDMGIDGSERIKPGSADSSLIYLRMIDLSDHRMPPLATSIIDSFGTELIGKWIDTLGTVSVIDGHFAGSVPEEFFLDKAYPNPFNATTTIGYQLPVISQVKLTIYDIQGREVITLVKEKQSPGQYQIQWYADNYSSGIYLYKLQTEKFVQVKKMILVK
jgi:mono/diheme cytochrome c family protein